MKGLDLLDALIEHYEQSLEIAQNEIQNNTNWTGNAGKGWLKDKSVAEKNLKYLKAIKEGIAEDCIKRTDYKIPNYYPNTGDVSTKVCWSNYRCMLVLDTLTHMIKPVFWTPDLGVANSHRSLLEYAKRNFIDENGYTTVDPYYRWGGFYTYGLGNYDVKTSSFQSQLTLYGESSDYPHNKYSEEVKKCFLTGKQFFIDDELPF